MEKIYHDDHWLNQQSVFKSYDSNKHFSELLQDGAKINWHRYRTKLCYCHPMHTDKSNSSSIPTLYWQTVEIIILEGKYFLESTDPRKSEIRAPPQTPTIRNAHSPQHAFHSYSQQD